MTPKQQRFVDEYMVDLNATQAAIRAGYSAHTANEQGSRLLANVSVQAAISIARKAQQERTGITADRVLTEIALVAFADARELVEVRKGCCRHCWGEGFKRQRTVGEMNAAVEQWRKDGKDPADFDQEGGIGYNPHRPPHPDCPDCVGEGHARTVIKDTRSLTPAAVALYAGAKETKYGIEVLSHSKMDAVEKLAKHVGLYEKDNQQKADPLSALLTRIAQGNGNGFAPVQNDPERTTSAGLPMKAQVQDDDED
ncbi:terminase small subunit [Acidovorax sp. RAC01]|uniref:terminase small subunit n=1 Tax=Acidovorax sp. RAC01 TaxID=1842533 RepID=UPI001E3C96CF|nr:terminase small subunit [Acidovorax sp. RAC01]